MKNHLLLITIVLFSYGCAEVPVAREAHPGYTYRYSGRPAEVSIFRSGQGSFEREAPDFGMRARLRPSDSGTRESNLIRCSGNDCDIVSPSGRVLNENP
jgi:hypothetical protein